MSSYKLGIIGYGQHARRNFQPAVEHHRNFEFAAALTSKPKDQIPPQVRHCQTPDEFFEADLDVVYIGSPNGLHFDQAKMCLEAGCHVIIEKPAVQTLEQAQTLVSLAEEKNLMVFEGFMYKSHPHFLKLKETIVGESEVFKRLDADFSIPARKDDDVRYKPELAGGALQDVGCYAVSLAGELLGFEPKSVQVSIEMHPQHGVETMGSAILTHDEGRHAVLSWGFGLAFHSSASVSFESKRLVASRIFSKPADFEAEILTQVAGNTESVVKVEAANPFVCMLDSVCDAMTNDRQKTTQHNKLLAQATLMDQVKRAAGLE